MTEVKKSEEAKPAAPLPVFKKEDKKLIVVGEEPEEDEEEDDEPLPEINEVKPKKKKKQLDPNGRKPKLSHSNYLWTINTNKQFNGRSDEADACIDKLMYAIDKVFDQENLEKNIIKINESDPDYRKLVSVSSDWFENIIVKKKIEIGPATNKLHAHVMVAIAHRARIKMDINVIKSQIMKHLGKGFYDDTGKKVMVNYRCGRDASANFEEYLRKWYPND